MSGYLFSEETKVSVLAVIRNSLLGDILESLLASTTRLQANRVQYVSPDRLWEGIKQYEPEIVVLEAGLLEAGSMSHLEFSPLPGRLRIIIINPAGNHIQVYDKFQVSMTRVADFVDLIVQFPCHQRLHD